LKQTVEERSTLLFFLVCFFPSFFSPCYGQTGSMDLFVYITVFLPAIALVSTRPRDSYLSDLRGYDYGYGNDYENANEMEEEVDEEANEMEEEVDEEANNMDEEFDEEANNMDENANEMKEEVDEEANKGENANEMKEEVDEEANKIDVHVTEINEADVQKRTACAGGMLNLTCDQGLVIWMRGSGLSKIHSRSCPHSPGSIKETDCGEKTDKHIDMRTLNNIDHLCTGHRVCNYHAKSSAVYETDPCPGPYKYVWVRYICVSPADPHYSRLLAILSRYTKPARKAELMMRNA